MVKNFFILINLIFSAVIHTNGQIFNNLDFGKSCDTSKTGLCYWDLSWGPKGSVKPDIVEKKKCLLLQGKNETSVVFVEQIIFVPFSKDIQILSITSDIKSDSVEGKGAGLNIGLYDKEGILIANKDMGGFYSVDWIRGTNKWKQNTISIVCPKETKKIKLGMILYGRGKVWYKKYNAQIIPISERKPGRLALKYITAVCDTIEMNSLVRDSIKIKTLKETALKIACQAKSYSDCYLAINYLLESLRPFGDEHSFFMTSKEVKNWKKEGSQVSKIHYPSYKIIDDCGYIIVPAFHSGNPKQILAYADTLQMAIQKLSLSEIKGWVIDVRQNTGGNMAPMIAGLGPLFSSEKPGSLVDVNGGFNSWYYINGKYFWDNDPGFVVSNPFKLTSKLPIAILTSNQTGSSGEAVVVSFIGNDITKSFGQSTWGLTTGNGSFELEDHSQIFLASTIMADRNGKLYRNRITPDFVIDNKETNNYDAVIKAAIKWITSQQR